MFSRFYAPIVALQGDLLTRRSGLFYRKSVRLPDVRRVVATIRDAVTHEETMVGFFDGTTEGVWISEFDRNFADVMKVLPTALPGMSSLDGFASGKPFDREQVTLWERSDARS